MSKYAIQGFTQGFLNSESEKLDQARQREQDRQDKIAETMLKMRMKGLELDKATYQKRKQEMENIRAIRAMGGPQAEVLAGTRYLKMHGLDVDSESFKEHASLKDNPEPWTRMLDQAEADFAQEREPEWTQEDMDGVWRRGQQQHNSFAATLKRFFGDDNLPPVTMTPNLGLMRNQMPPLPQQPTDATAATADAANATAVEGSNRQAVEGSNRQAVEGRDYEITGPDSMNISISGGTEGAAEGNATAAEGAVQGNGGDMSVFGPPKETVELGIDNDATWEDKDGNTIRGTFTYDKKTGKPIARHPAYISKYNTEKVETPSLTTQEEADLGNFMQMQHASLQRRLDRAPREMRQDIKSQIAFLESDGWEQRNSKGEIVKGPLYAVLRTEVSRVMAATGLSYLQSVQLAINAMSDASAYAYDSDREIWKMYVGMRDKDGNEREHPWYLVPSLQANGWSLIEE